MKICLKLTDFNCEYLKTNFKDKDLETVERVPKRLQNADSKRRETCRKIQGILNVDGYQRVKED